MVHIYRKPVKDNAPATTRHRPEGSRIGVTTVGKAFSKAQRKKQREQREQAARGECSEPSATSFRIRTDCPLCIECRSCLAATNAGAKGHVTLAKSEDGSVIGSKLLCRHTWCHE